VSYIAEQGRSFLSQCCICHFHEIFPPDFKSEQIKGTIGMATNIGTLKEKSKSETPRQNNRVKFRRPPKYKSMTLRRQEATLDVTLNDSIDSICPCDDCDPPCNGPCQKSLNISVSDTSSTNSSFSHFFDHLNVPKIFRSPPKNVKKNKSATNSPCLEESSRSKSYDPIKTSPSLTTINSADPNLDISANHHDLSIPNNATDPRYLTIDSKHLKSAHMRKTNVHAKKLLDGVKQFNSDPKRGLEFLSNAGILNKDSSKEVSLFLYREGRLSKQQIGAFLGGHNEFNQSVLSEFVSLHEFTHLILVQALRQFLWSFRLPGEAMQIDRIMDAFAKHYCNQNPNLFDEKDTCYILSFAVIMLNTSLHNPNVKTKITCEQFVAQNRGINSGKDIPRDILEMIYDSIKGEPFKIPDESYDDLMYTFFSPEKEGWLLKQGGGWKNWKRRWFVLNDRCLYYFQYSAENVPKGIVPLENVKVRMLEDSDGKRFMFEVYSENDGPVKGCKTDSKGTVVQGKHKTYRMAANSHEDRTHWVSAIQDSIQVDPAYDIVRQKKAALRRKSIRPRDHDIPTNSDSGNGNSEMVATVSRSKSNVQEERSNNFKHKL